jgi:hypothetical protein
VGAYGQTLLRCHSLGEAGKRHSLGAGRFNRATTASGVKVAQHPQGLTLTPARDGGAGLRAGKVTIYPGAEKEGWERFEFL